MRRKEIVALLALLVAWAILMTWHTVAQAADRVPAVESFDDVQVVSPADAEGKPKGVGELIGRLHPALVHFPIAFLVGLAFVDFVGLILKRAVWQAAGMVVLVGTMVSLLPAAATGLLRAAHMPTDTAEHALLVTHRTLNFSVAGLVLVALAARVFRRNRLEGAWRIIYLVLVFAATGLVLLAADYGGRMVYGPNYLPF